MTTGDEKGRPKAAHSKGFGHPVSRTSLHNHTAGVNPSPGLDVNLPTYHRPPAGAIIAGALDALARGAYLLAVNPADKTPMVASAQAYLDGRRNLTAGDVEWYEGRGALFAVALKPSGLVVGDLDAPDLDDAGPLASHFAGPHVSPTRSGGRHAWFTRPRGVPAKRRIKPVPGAAVDVLAGGYAILWAGFLPPAAELPPDIARILTDPPPPPPMPPPAGGGRGPSWSPAEDGTADDVRAWIAVECDDVARSTDGGRNNRLNLATFRIARRAWLAPGIEAEARAALELAGGAAGLPLAEVRRTIAGAWARGARQPWLPRDPKHPAGDGSRALAPDVATWQAVADAFIRQAVKNGAARERNRRLIEKSAELASAGDGETFSIGGRAMGQRAGLSGASAARGMRDLVELGALTLVAPWSIDAATHKHKPAVYRLARAFGGGETVSGIGGGQGGGVSLSDRGDSVSLSAKRVSTALRVGLGKRAPDAPAYLSTRWRSWAALSAAARPMTAAELGAAVGVARRTAADHVAYFRALAMVEGKSEATGGRPAGLWAVASGAAAAVARVTEWGRTTIARRWSRIKAAWAALAARAAPLPLPDAQSFGLRVERIARAAGAVVTVTPAVLP